MKTMGKNWNSKSKEYTDIIKPDTLNKALTAKKLKQQGSSVQEIADKLNVSKSRVYEYLRT